MKRPSAMSDLATYLNGYFLTAERLAEACSMSETELASLMGARLVPLPSYVVTPGGVLQSAVFPDAPASGAPPGEYFHPGNAAWVSLAESLREAVGAEQARRQMKDRFTRKFGEALAEQNARTFRLPDAFDDDGKPIAEGLRSRTEAAWSSFLKGIFGLCVADPSSERSIAKKEILQEALTKLTSNGRNVELPHETRSRVIELIDEYDRSAMPFSPAEYPKSSRKRLVDDLRKALALPTGGDRYPPAL